MVKDMRKRTLNILSFSVIIIISTVFVLWQDGTLDPNKKKIAKGLYIKKNENNTFTALYGNKQRLVAYNVDSIIISNRYGTMVHGIGEDETIKFWYYVNTSNDLFGGWNDSIFREEGILSIGRKYLDSVQISQDIWNEY